MDRGGDVDYRGLLLPCPFCGNKGQVYSTDGMDDSFFGTFYYDVKCTNDECFLHQGGRPFYKTPKEVVDLWNKRK